MLSGGMGGDGLGTDEYFLELCSAWDKTKIIITNTIITPRYLNALLLDGAPAAGAGK